MPGSFSKLLLDIQEDEQRSHEEFINRYRAKYFEEQFLPFWMVVEVMPFGQLFTLFRNSDKGLKKNISSIYGVFPPVFDSWLHTLNYIRNACAHHVRLWNRPLPVAPQFPDKKNDPDWHTPAFIQNNKIFAVLTICQYLLLRIGLDDYWKTNLMNLLTANPGIPLGVMGFPVNWRDIQFWK